MTSYTVTLDTCQTHHMTLELTKVEAKTGEHAIAKATKLYLATGRRDFLVCDDEIEDENVAFATAEEDE